MKRFVSIILFILLIAVVPYSSLNAKQQQSEEKIKTVKKERRHVRSGNKKYEKKRYAEAEVEYRKALQENPSSPIATFNLATSLLRQSNAKGGGKDSVTNLAQQLFANVMNLTKNKAVQSKSFYDLGNIAYSNQQYDQAIELYKNALRRDPTDNDARYNLRMAQLKKKQQDQNKDKQQNKDDKKDNKDNKDKDKQNKQDNNKNNQQQQPQQAPNMSNQNIEQILKAMQNQEDATQQRVNAQKGRINQQERNRTRNKW